MADIDFQSYGITPANQPIDYNSYGITPAAEGATSKNVKANPDFLQGINEASSQSLYSNPVTHSQMIEPTKEIGKDIGSTASQLLGMVARGITNIPKDIQYLRENVPQAASQIANDPARVGRNALAGGADLLGGISRIPTGLADYLEKAGMLKPGQAKMMAQPFNEKEVTEYGNKFVGEDKKPGDELIRGAVRNIPSIYGGAKLAQYFNPLKLTEGNITKDILGAKSTMKEKYSGEKGLYNNLFKEAESRGAGQVPFNEKMIDIDTIKKHSPEKYYEATEKFIQNPSLENAQKAMSDMGVLERQLGNKTTLTSPERETLQAAINAKKTIQENMFKNVFGKIYPDLVERHQKIQKGYANEVVPYTKDKAIRSFEKGELSKSELISRLSKGKFAAKRGEFHPRLANRETLNHILGSKITQNGAGLAAGGWILKKILNDNK